jgi:ATP phosphoribosyltransferase regulatory subunit HisZ
MEDGRLTELGTHDALVAGGGAYAALWRSWHGDRPATPWGVRIPNVNSRTTNGFRPKF